MKAWNEKQFKYEKLFIQLQDSNNMKNNTNTINDIGKVLLVIIAICKDTNNLKAEEQEIFWKKISEDLIQLEQLIQNYFQEDTK